MNSVAFSYNDFNFMGTKTERDKIISMNAEKRAKLKGCECVCMCICKDIFRVNANEEYCRGQGWGGQRNEKSLI